MDKLPSIKPVRTAICGCGGITPFVLKGIDGIKELDVRIVQDINPESAKGIASGFTISRCCEDFQEILSDDIELIVLNTPNDCHRDMAIEAFKAGKHCFVQKPLARNVTEAQEMIDAAKQYGRLLGVVMLERGNPVYQQMRSMINAGIIGKVTSVRGAMGHINHLARPPAMDDWRSLPEKIGGGSFLQLAVHHMDIAQFILGQNITEVIAVTESVIDKKRFPTDETTSASVKFSGGVIGQFLSSFTTVIDSFEINSPEGMIRKFDNVIQWKTNNPYEGELWDINGDGNNHVLNLSQISDKMKRLEKKYEPHRNFAYAIRGVAPVDISGEDGLNMLKIVEAVYESIEGRKSILVSSH